MHGVVKKWGNSLALRLPKVLAQEIGLSDDFLVKFSVINGNLVVSKMDSDLSKLVGLINGDNLHEEISTGSVIGKEIW